MRKERREIVRQNYLADKARRPIIYYSLLVENMTIIFCKEIFEILYGRFQQKKNHRMWGVPKTPFLLQAFTCTIKTLWLEALLSLPLDYLVSGIEECLLYA